MRRFLPLPLRRFHFRSAHRRIVIVLIFIIVITVVIIIVLAQASQLPFEPLYSDTIEARALREPSIKAFDVHEPACRTVNVFRMEVRLHTRHLQYHVLCRVPFMRGDILPDRFAARISDTTAVSCSMN